MKLSKRQEAIAHIVREKGPVTGSAIAEHLDVTRSALRSDLAVLTMIGVLEARPNVGYYYVGLSPKDQTAEILRSYSVHDVLSQAVIVSPETNLYDTIVTIFTEDVGTILVCEDSYLQGVVSRKDLLRASIMSASNSYRLGANEAPPAILSCFLGSQLSSTLDEIVRQVGNEKMTPEEKTTLKLGIGRIPEILLDTTDRNRTSPFAFTGNRFEFRAAGSSSNCAASMIAINAAMANQLNEFRASVEKLMEEGVGKDEAIFRILKETIIASEPIRFEGDGYSEEWKQEAARRGLTNICHVPEALMHYIDNQSKSVLIGERIFNETELNSRLEVELEKYTMKVQIEGRVLGDLAINHIVPTAVAYQNRLLENLRGLKEIFPAEEYEVLSADRKELIREISHRVTSIKVLVREMTEARKVANHMENYKERAFAYEEKVRPYLDQIRDHIDHLEMEVDDEIWPLPKYRELLFTK